MKNIINIYTAILPLILLFLTQCYYNHHNSAKNDENYAEEIEKIEFISIPYEEPYPQFSFYYSYNFNSTNEKIIDIKNFLSNLYSKGFKIQAAWYFAGGGCGNSRVYVSPQLIVQLEKNDFDLINYNFSSLSEKPKIKCEKNAGKYIPEE